MINKNKCRKEWWKDVLISESEGLITPVVEAEKKNWGQVSVCTVISNSKIQTSTNVDIKFMLLFSLQISLYKLIIQPNHM